MLFPLPLVLLGVALGLILWRIAGRRELNTQRSARAVRNAGSGAIAGALLVLCVLSTAPVADSFLGSLERRYEPLVTLPDDVELVVVLGAGHIEWDRFQDSAQPGDAGLARAVEALRLTRDVHSGVITVFTGFAGAGEFPTAEVARRTAVRLGMPEERTRVIPEPRDTREEARAVAELLGPDAGQTRIVLVTSASHMPRAVGEFALEGLDVIPAPAGYRAYRGPYSAWSLLPSAAALQRSESAWYEYMGLLWSAVSGR